MFPWRKENKEKKISLFNKAPDYDGLLEITRVKNKGSFKTAGNLLADVNDYSRNQIYEIVGHDMIEYSDLNLSQLKSYIRWRTKIRKGIFEPADCSYIFLHVFELINLFGIDKEDAFSQLLFLLDNSEKLKLPTVPYLKRWIYDFYRYYEVVLSSNDLAILNEILKEQRSVSKINPKVFVNALNHRDYRTTLKTIYPNEDICKSLSGSLGCNPSEIEGLLLFLIHKLHINHADIINKVIIEKFDNYFDDALFIQPWKWKSEIGVDSLYLNKLGKTIKFAVFFLFNLKTTVANPNRDLLDKKTGYIILEILQEYAKGKGWKTRELQINNNVRVKNANHNMPDGHKDDFNKKRAETGFESVMINVDKLEKARKVAERYAENKLTKDINEDKLGSDRSLENEQDEISSKNIVTENESDAMNLFKKTGVTSGNAMIVEGNSVNEHVLNEYKQCPDTTSTNLLNNNAYNLSHPAKPKIEIEIEIDINRLKEIKIIADKTTEKLIPEDLYAEYMIGDKENDLEIEKEIMDDDMDEWEQFALSLSDNNYSILKIITESSEYCYALSYAVANNLMIEEEIELINEAALDSIGDILIESDGNMIVIIEEYRDEVNKIINKGE